MWKYSLLFLALFLATLFSLAVAIDPNFIEHIAEYDWSAMFTNEPPPVTPPQ